MESRDSTLGACARAALDGMTPITLVCGNGIYTASCLPGEGRVLRAVP